ncbi:MAG: EamA-like transporter family protein, partial [Hamadaea sp.]|nr:EamA-like transporter family protein [Hamadaea sp.]
MTATEPGPAVTRWRRAAGIATAFGAGLAIAAQARVNGALADRLHDGVAAALVSYAVSMLILAVVITVVPSARRGLAAVGTRLRGGDLRPWEILGGAGGTVVVTAQGLAVSALGVAPFTVAVV